MVPAFTNGWLCGLLYKFMNRNGKDGIIAVGTASISGALMNTLFFYDVLYAVLRQHGVRSKYAGWYECLCLSRRYGRPQWYRRGYFVRSYRHGSQQPLLKFIKKG